MTHLSNKREEQLLLLKEQLHRRKCQESLEYWARTVAPDFVEPGVDATPAAHHLLLLYHLEQVALGKCKRLIINMGPGSAKSTFTSKTFPTWYMARFPKRNVIGASNTATLAESFSRSVQDTMREHSRELGCYPLEDNKELWRASNGSQYRSAGVGGVITGFRADLAIIDDPITNRQAAYSPTVRDSVWGWYKGDLFTRVKPGGAIIIIQTRWHVDDLTGRLLDEQGDDWTVVTLPTLWDSDEPEPAFPLGLGRTKGQLLWPEYQDAEFIAGAQKTLGSLDFSAMHQQQPVSAEGNLFKIAGLGVVDVEPANPRLTFRAWDFGATEGAGDYTVGVKAQANANGTYTILDVQRAQLSPHGVEQLLLETAIADGKSVRISLPQDPGQAGKSQVASLMRLLAGYDVHHSTESGHKEVRPRPFAAQVEAGNVNMLAGKWNEAFRDELRLFPGGKYDDQVDAATRAFTQLVEPPLKRRATTWGQSFHMGR